jgi:hypothetical protein
MVIKSELELLDDKKSILVEKIKAVIGKNDLNTQSSPIRFY